ncbi:MAG: hypothetical protein HOI53_07725 [Francisellaceae bacterium]|nr:hypothetical protein [Francisellaceae bacterium]MBT6207902.1 hypothetical protein [Francisellaceae bacterium]
MIGILFIFGCQNISGEKSTTLDHIKKDIVQGARGNYVLNDQKPLPKFVRDTLYASEIFSVDNAIQKVVLPKQKKLM